MNSWHPGLILMATGLAVLVLPERLRRWTAFFGPLAALAAMLSLEFSASLSYRFTADITLELLRVDSLSWLFGLVFCVIAVLAGLYSLRTECRGEKGASLIYAGSSICVVFAGDWISLICFWEIMAVSSCCLVWAGKSHQARRASYRYLVMHFFGGNMLLAGAMLLYTGAGFQIEPLTGGSGWAYWLIFLGVAVNGAVPPLHTWVPDAYPQSTPAGTVYMGSYTTKVAIYAFIRLFAGTEWLVLAGALMAVFGVCMALIENDLRRLLSYHIVSQLGMMVSALGTGLATGIDGAALHAVFNILYKGVLLMGAGAVFLATGKRKITELGGLYREMPLTAFCFLIGSLAIAGMPPLNGFVSKALIMEALKDGGFTAAYWLVMLAGIGTWLSITLKINYFVFFGGRKGETRVCRKVPLGMQAAMVICAALCLLTGVFPELTYSLSPEGSAGHPYTAEHVAEYIGMFVGATAAFFILRGKMAPHDRLTLDFDWFYRRPLSFAVFGLSRLTAGAFSRVEQSAENFVRVVKLLPNSPGKVFSSFRRWQKEEDNMPVGEFMQTFILFCIIAFIFILIIE